MNRYLNVTEARSALLDLVDRLHESDRVVITKRGRPRAVLLDFERYELLEDVVWVIQDPGRRAAMQRAWNEARERTTIRGPARRLPTVESLRKVLKGRRARKSGA